MPVELEISLDKTIKELDLFLDDYKFKAVTLSARQGINRAIKTTRSFAIKEIRQRRKIKLEDLKGSKKKGKKAFVSIRRAFGKDLFKLEGRVKFSGVSLPLIMFIVGQATPRVQTKANKGRKPRAFRLTPGEKELKKGLFVEKASRGDRRFQVFRRRNPSKKSKGTAMQSAPSVAQLLRSKTAMLRSIENKALNSLVKEFNTALRFNLRKVRL